MKLYLTLLNWTVLGVLFIESRLFGIALRLIVGLFALMVITATAATIMPASMALTDWQTAYTSASDGDTIRSPGGTATWNSQLIDNGKALTVDGNNNTTITLGTGSGVFWFHGLGGGNGTIKNVVFKNFTISDNGSGAGGGNALVVFGDYGETNSSWRCCSNTFINVVGTAIQTRSYDWGGLVDHNQGNAAVNSGTSNFIIVRGGPAGNCCSPVVFPTGFESNSYVFAGSVGTTNCVTIEYNTWTQPVFGNGWSDAQGGARYTVRYNTLTNCVIAHHGADTGFDRSVRQFEVYGNNLYATITLVWPFEFRGGTGVCYNNTVTTLSGGNWQNKGIFVRCYRANTTYTFWGALNGSNPVDGNQITGGNGAGYPGCDQIGRGSPTTSFDSNTVQPLNVVYGWGNTIDGATLNMKTPPSSSPPENYYVAEGRDYTNNVGPPVGYTPLVTPHPLAFQSILPPSPTNVTAIYR